MGGLAVHARANTSSETGSMELLELMSTLPDKRVASHALSAWQSTLRSHTRTKVKAVPENRTPKCPLCGPQENTKGTADLAVPPKSDTLGLGADTDAEPREARAERDASFDLTFHLCRRLRPAGARGSPQGNGRALHGASSRGRLARNGRKRPRSVSGH